MTRVFLSLLFLPLLAVALLAPRCEGSDVLIVGDTQLRPVTEVIAAIEKAVDRPTRAFAATEVRGRLRRVAEEERARVVVVLGRDSLAEALSLPPSIAVIYGLVVTPPETDRPNTTGCYMATPVQEYVDLASRYLPSLRRIAVVGSRDQLSVLARAQAPPVVPYAVNNTFALVRTLQELEGADAVLLLPSASLLTTAALEGAYLESFRRGIPLLGISERNVKQGALLALVVDAASIGRQIGEYASKALAGADIGSLPAAPPKRFELFVNLDTARKMGIRLPDEMTKMARRTYP